MNKSNQLDQETGINFIDISHTGSLIVSKIKEHIFIRVIKSPFFVSDLANMNQYTAQQSIMFMPIYLDEDHNFNINRKFFNQQRPFKNTTLDDLRLSTIEDEESRDVDN